MKIFTWNVRTLYTAGGLRILESIGNKYKADLIALQEIRWTGEGVLHKKNFDLFYSCDKKNHLLGTGFLVGRKLKPNILDFKAISPRMCVIRLKAKFFNISIVNIHAPTEEKDDEEKEGFYEELDRAYNSCNDHDIKIVIGDANAKVGREEFYSQHIGKFSLHERCNNNGERLVNFAASKNMIIGSTMFERKDIHKATWISPCKRYRNQIDHVLIDARHISNLMNVRSYLGANIDSDHYFVGAVLRARISRSKIVQKDSKKRYNLSALKDKNVSEDFSNQAASQLALQTNVGNGDINRLWNKYKISLEVAAENVLGRQGKRKRNEWFDDECKLATEKKNTAYMKLQQGQATRANCEAYKELRRLEKSTHKAKKRAQADNALKELEDLRDKNETRKFYKSVNSERNSFSPQTILCKNLDGQIISDVPQILERWVEHFEALLCATTTEPFQVPEGCIKNNTPQDPPTQEEVLLAVKKLKNNKSPGTDEIPAELIKHSNESLMTELHHICTEVWNNEEMPAEWNTGLICPIHKKGDKMICGNYRGITLLNTGYKVIANILYERLRPWAEQIIGEYQSGFRSGRSTNDQIFVLRQILQKLLEFNTNSYHMFVDFKAAYDSVIRANLYATLYEFGIPDKLVRLIKMTMQNIVCHVKIKCDTSRPFEPKNGLRQGDALACLLFNLALEKVVRDSNINASGNLYTKSVQLLAYADDVDIAARSIPDMREAFIKMESAAANMGLIVNKEKTKIMASYPQKGRAPNVSQNLTINDSNYEVVDSFQYLGSTVNRFNTVSEEIQRRILAANKCFYGLKKHFRSSLLSRTTKVRLYRTLVKPTLTYASETWATTTKDEEALGIYERKLLRSIFGAVNESGVWRRRYNHELYQLYKYPDIVTEFRVQRLQYAGHIVRASTSFPPRMVLSSDPDGRRKPGKPRKRWKDCVDEDARVFGLAGWEARAKDRATWRQSLKQAKARSGL